MMPVSPLDTNRLLSWALGLFTAYFATGFLVDPLWYSVVISAFLLVGGVFVAARSVPEAVDLIRKDKVGSGELAVIALALISTGAVWSGAFNMIYAWYGRPEQWIGTISSFGRAMIAVGFYVLFLSPDATHQGVRWPRWYILLAAAAVIAVVSFLIGYTLRDGTMSSSEMFLNTTRGLVSDLLAVRKA